MSAETVRRTLPRSACLKFAKLKVKKKSFFLGQCYIFTESVNNKITISLIIRVQLEKRHLSCTRRKEHKQI